VATPNASEMERAMARSKSYVSSAIITLIAYAVFWLPGVIFNIMYLNEARRNQKIAGQSLPGVGCLWILLIINVVWVGGLCLLLTGGAGLSAMGGR